MTPAPAIDRKGLAAAIASYVLWGVFPLYWYLLKHVPAIQIIAHRIVWCALFVVGYLVIREGWGWLRTALSRPKVGWMLLGSSGSTENGIWRTSGPIAANSTSSDRRAGAGASASSSASAP